MEIHLILVASWSIFTPRQSGMIAENLKILRNRIEQACARCGRRLDEIQLVAVSKTFPVEMIQAAITAGQLDFGENFVQELQAKRQYLTERQLRWHFIGHLQSNKVKYILDYVHLIHSVDNFNLGKEIDKRAGRSNRIQDILVEVHTTSEATKFGVLPENTIPLVEELARLANVRICGLMTMGPFSNNPNDSRSSFRQLNKLKRQIETAGIENISMQHLSMGMTNDFEIAIEEGTTILRIGSAIFGNR